MFDVKDNIDYLIKSIVDYIKTIVDSINSKTDIVDSNIDSIKAKTDNLPTSPANETTLLAVKAKTDNLPTDMTAQLNTIESYIDTEVSAIKAKTDNLPSDPADQSLIDAKLGVTTDFAAHQTVLGYQNSLYQHAHQQARCYPSLADGIVITGGVPSWTLGNFAEIIPANTITHEFDIHYIIVESVSATDIYELVLYKGALGQEVEIGRVRVDRENATSGSANVPIQIPAQLANTRISAKVASKSGNNDTMTISVYYHLYS